jgi:arabinogalactan endo-1,4-beta-galactosidase
MLLSEFESRDKKEFIMVKQVSYLKRITLMLLILGVVSLFARPYIIGVDISWVQEEESAGVRYYDEGVQKDIFEILKDHGVNFIRWRTFVNPCAPEGYASQTWNLNPGAECWCDLEHTIKFAKRIKAAGMGFLHDYHMSDTWASIGHQNVPSAWAGMSDAEMQKAAYNYIKNDLEALIAEGLRPDAVQVGNEINSKMSGVSISSPDRLAALINAGVKAVRDVDPTIKIVMQHGQPRPEKGFESWYNFINSRIDFDIISGSTYGTTNDGQDWRDMFGLAVKNGQMVMSVECTANKYDLINTVMSEFPSGLGMGSFVWEPTSYPQAESKYWMFDHNGKEYHANANLDKLLNWAKKMNAELPDWVQLDGGTQYDVSVTSGPGGTTVQTPANSKISEGKKVEITAEPLDGWEFTGWSGDYSGNENPYVIASLEKNVSVKANFKFIGTDSTLYEGENTKQTNAFDETKHLGFSGAGYVNFDNQVGSSVEFDVVVGSASEKIMTITYANGAMDERPVSISVNGKVIVESFGFTPTETWETWATHDTKVTLAAGINTIVMTSTTENGGPNIDKIELSEETQRAILNKYKVAFIPSTFNTSTKILNVGSENTLIQLFSIDGTLILNKTLKSSEYQLPMQLSKGLYFLRIKSANQESLFKVIQR